MEVRCDEGIASHIDLEPYPGLSEDVSEASVGKYIGQPLSREIALVPGADTVNCVEGDMGRGESAGACLAQRGRVTIVRYADDFVMGFEKEADARELLVDIEGRLAQFGLMLHEEKTRLIEFGRFATLTRRKRGKGRPKTFAFLGVTYYCGWTRETQVHPEAQDAKQSPDAQAEGVAPRGVEPDACPASRAAPLLRPRTARSLRLFRRSGQLAGFECVHARNSANLAHLPAAAQSKEPGQGLGVVRTRDNALSLAKTSDYAPMDTTTRLLRVTSKRSRVRESRMPGSVRATPNGLATRPVPVYLWYCFGV